MELPRDQAGGLAASPARQVSNVNVISKLREVRSGSTSWSPNHSHLVSRQVRLVPNHIHLVSRPGASGSPITFTWSGRPGAPGSSTTITWSVDRVRLVPQPHSPGRSTRCAWSPTTFTWSVDQVRLVTNHIHVVSRPNAPGCQPHSHGRRPDAPGSQPHSRGQSTRCTWLPTTFTWSSTKCTWFPTISTWSVDHVLLVRQPHRRGQMASTGNPRPQQSGKLG